MFSFKPISKEAIPRALKKAEHYRLLNDPWHAESICLDILEVDPGHQESIYVLIMALTDQFHGQYPPALARVREWTKKLEEPYYQFYCSGLIYERQAIASLRRAAPRANYIAHNHLIEAMKWYEKAEEVRSDANDDALLRWNACVRLIEKHQIKPAPEESGIQPFLDV